MKSKRIPYEDFVNIYSRVPRVNVEVILTVNGGLVLTKRSIEPCIGEWHIPGGTIYLDETPEDAVVRVAKEEMGVKVKIDKLVGIITYPKIRRDGYFGWPIGIAYEVSLMSGELSGSYQGEEIKVFDKIPINTVHDQILFIKEHLPSLV